MFIEQLYAYVMGAIIWWAGPNCGSVSPESSHYLQPFLLCLLTLCSYFSYDVVVVCCCFWFIKINFFSKTTFRIAIRVSNSLDPHQERLSVGPDLGPNCLQRLLADDKNHRQQSKRNWKTCEFCTYTLLGNYTQKTNTMHPIPKPYACLWKWWL